MAKTFDCSVVTPERGLFDESVVYANVPAHDGQMGFMPDRAPILLKLGAGMLNLQLPDGEQRRFRLDGGFAQMHANRLTLLSEKAAIVEKTDDDQAQN